MGDSETRKEKVSVFFFLVFLCKVHLLSSPHLPFCRVLPHSVETEPCRSNKNHSRVIFFEGCLFIFTMLFASRLRSLPHLFLPFSLWPSKGSRRVRAMHRSAMPPAAPTSPNSSTVCRWGGGPCLDRPWDAVSLVKLGKQTPCVWWMAKWGQGGWLGAAVPTAHSVSVTGVREFNSQHANHLEQSTELFVSSPFISFPFPNNHPLLTLGFLAVFCSESWRYMDKGLHRNYTFVFFRHCSLQMTLPCPVLAPLFWAPYEFFL